MSQTALTAEPPPSRASYAPPLTLQRPLSRWVGLFDVDEFFQPLSSAAPTVSAYLAAQDPATTVVKVENVWFGACPNASRYAGLVTQACQTRELLSVPHHKGRGKCLVRPDNVSKVIVHTPALHSGRAVVANSTSALRMNHYKPGKTDLRNATYDATMAAFGPGLAAEIRRAYPEGIPALPGCA